MAKYKLCRCRYRYKIKNVIRKKIALSIFFIFSDSLALLTPLSLVGLLSFGLYPALTSAQSFFSTLFGLYPCFSKIADYLKIFSTFKIASDAYLVAFAAKLQFHYWILAFGLTKYICLLRLSNKINLFKLYINLTNKKSNIRHINKAKPWV